MDQIYTEAATKYSTFSDQIASEDNINIFVNSVTGFFKVSGATGKQQQYDSATKLINAGLELALLEDENYFDFAEAYETYFTLPPLLVDAWTIDRTERFISAVTYILKYDDKIEWVTNEAQIRPYVEMAREIYNEGIDIYYSNAKELYDAFSEIDNFYYEKLQTEHIAYINECFARFEKATIYVEKIGICDDIARYFESGTVDFSNEEIKALYDKYLDTRASIEGDLENYNALLEMNMNLFVAEMAKLDGAVTFAEKTAVYNAATRYVNSMSLSTEAAVEAKVVYEELGEYIKEATKVAENFVNSVMLLATIEDDDAMYYALVACYRELQNVNVEVDGAYDAKLAFEATLDNYNYTVYSANSDVEKSQDCVLSCDSCGNSVAVIISYYLFK